MRIAVAGGGTGGHVYPALSVLEALEGEAGHVDVLWMGQAGKLEEEVARVRGWLFVALRVAQVRGAGFRAPLAALTNVGSSVFAARELRRFSPGAVFATGGYASVPGVVGARLAGIPVLLFVPDVDPGWAVRFTCRFAHVIATSCEAGREPGRPCSSVGCRRQSGSEKHKQGDIALGP